jgi:hypothetical protein
MSFRNILSAKSAGASQELLAALTKTFGSFDNHEVFSNSATPGSKVGMALSLPPISSWQWKYPNQDNPLWMFLR